MSAFNIIDEEKVSHPIIKVIGCGGGGGNAVSRMLEEGVDGVDFIAANTDMCALAQCTAHEQIVLGRKTTSGLGAGGLPSVGEKAAEESGADIENKICGANMVFVTAGMGGGTGTGATPVIARIARELGCLVVGVVTLPFAWEQSKKMKQAEDGVNKLREHVDSLIVVPNENLFTCVDRNISLEEAFKKIDEILLTAVRGISGIITSNGRINIDFADVQTAMKNKGDVIMGIGRSREENGGVESVKSAIKNPLINNVMIRGATELLVNITSSNQLSLDAFKSTMEFVAREAGDKANLVPGWVIDESLENEVVVTIIATGMKNAPLEPKDFPDEKIPDSHNDSEVPMEKVEREHEHLSTEHSQGMPREKKWNDEENRTLSYKEWTRKTYDRSLTASIPGNNSFPRSGRQEKLSEDILSVPTYLRWNRKRGEGEGEEQ